MRSLDSQADTRFIVDKPSTTNPILPGCARRLVYEVDGKRLIDQVDLDIEPGSITVMMGPNGAGKSILLRMLHGLVRPTSGEVHWAGRPIDEAIRKSQAMVFQRPVLLRRSVVANVRFVLGRGERARSHEILRRVGLAELATQPARLLSSGEQQRLALARALAMEPRVLFLDEPTANLDPAATASIENIARAARDRGTKIVLVTHDLGQARRMADEVVFMHRGRIVERTPANSFFDKPISSAAADYLEGKLLL